MSRALAVVAWAHAALFLFAVAATAQPAAGRPRVIEIVLHNTLQQMSASSLQQSLDDANAQQPAAILLNISSPGGTVESGSAMVQSIEHSAAPVIVYVREPQTKVSGEALLLLNAGAVSAMHPDAMLEMLHPAGLPWRQAEQAQQVERWNASLRAQIVARGRPLTVFSDLFAGSDTMTAQEALRSGFIDATDRTDELLLNHLDGRTVRLSSGRSAALHLQDYTLEQVPLSQRDHLMRALMNPDLTVLLLTLGALLIYLEINTPGGVVPGVAGLLLVLLAGYAFGHMPLRWEGIALLCVSIALMLFESHFRRGTAVALAGVACLVIGLRLLVRGPIPELQVDWSTAVGAGLGFGGITAGLLLLGMRARQAKIQTGAEAMIGWLAVAQTPLEPAGQVLVRGELWSATLDAGAGHLQMGECVTVRRLKGNTLVVAPLPAPGQA